MNAITWKRGNYIKFYAKMKIRIGGANAVDVQKGDEFEYDGSIIKYSGMEISSPQLRTAIASGWASTESQSAESVESIRPSRSLAKSQSVNTDLSRVQRGVKTELTTSSMDEDEVLRVSDRSNSQKVLNASSNRKFVVNPGEADSQEAVSIGRVRTSAKTVFNDITKPEYANMANKIENMSGVKADLYQTIEKEGVTIKTTNIGHISSVKEFDDSDGKVVGKVKNSKKASSEGISVTDTSLIRNKKKSDEDFVIVKSVDPRIRVARAIDPDFPLNWNFTGKLAERMVNVKNHGVSAKFLEALYAAEGDQMRKVLTKEFPKQFSV